LRSTDFPALERLSFFSHVARTFRCNRFAVPETIESRKYSPMISSSLVKRLLGRGLPESALAPVLTQMARLQRKGVRRIFRDGDLWIHETDIGYFAYQEPYLRLDLRRLHEIAKENFLWGYTPTSGDVIIDVGAGVGEEALTFARAVGEYGKVICIEAHPKTYRCLKALVAYNHLENVVPVHQAAAGPCCLTITIEDSADYLSNRVQASDGITVSATTIDAIRRQLRLDRVNFLKMNIEGAERLAVCGMTETLKHTQALCICCHDFLADEGRDTSCRTKQVVREFLHENGFTVIERSEPASPAYINHQLWAYNPALVSLAVGWVREFERLRERPACPAAKL
jgi:FkbM family methyltransferase